MGYKAQRRVYKLNFADEDMAGFVVRAYGMSFGQAIDFGDLAELEGKENLSAEELQRVLPVFELFIEHVLEWNLEDENDQPIKPSIEALLGNDLDWVMKVVDAWMRAATAVALPLGPPSSDGEQSPVLTLPMEPLSESLVS